MKDKGKKVMENIGEKRTDMLRNWEEKSSAIIDAFLLLFGRDGRLVGTKISRPMAANIVLCVVPVFILFAFYYLIQLTF